MTFPPMTPSYLRPKTQPKGSPALGKSLSARPSVCPQAWCVRRACCTTTAPPCAAAPAFSSLPWTSAVTTVPKAATVLKANTTRTHLTFVCPCKSQEWGDDSRFLSLFPSGLHGLSCWFLFFLSSSNNSAPCIAKIYFSHYGAVTCFFTKYVYIEAKIRL